MATIDKLNYISETKDRLKTVANYAGAGISADTFRSYSEKIYNSYIDIINGDVDIKADLPKLNSEGISIDIEDALDESLIDFSLYGDTEQTQTTQGKNLIPTSASDWEQGGIDASNGTNTTRNDRLRTKGYYQIKTNTDYYVSIQSASYCFLNIILYNSSKSYVGQYYSVDSNINGTRGLSINIPSSSYPNVAYMRVVLKNADSTSTITPSEITTIKPQIELGTSATSWEEFIPNSPSPTYPQDIHVVSGDNTIEICGKNKYSGIIEYDNYVIASNGAINSASNFCVSSLIDISSSSNWYLSFVFGTGSDNTMRIGFYDKNKTFISRSTTTSNTQLTIPENAKYLRLSYLKSGFSNIQLEQNTTASEYEPYQGQNYPINLPVENLFDKSGTPISNAGTTLTEISTGVRATISSTGTNKYSAIKFTNSDKLLGKTLNISATITPSSTNNGEIRLYFSNGNTLTSKIGAGTSFIASGDYSFEIPSNYPSGSDGIAIVFTSNRTTTTTTVGDYVDYTDVMVCLGSKANSYTPYGTPPIELCKIGDYEDKFIRTSGKNSFDKDSAVDNYRLTTTGGVYSDNGYFVSPFIKAESNTIYTKNSPIADAYHRVCFYTEQDVNSFIDRSENNTFTTPNNCNYIRICGLITEKDTTQIEKGSSPTEYEPFGSDEWYLKKAIEKIVLTSDMTWYKSGTTAVDKYYTRLSYDWDSTLNRSGSLCNYYHFKTNGTNIGEFDYSQNNDKLALFFCFATYNTSDVNNFKN